MILKIKEDEEVQVPTASEFEAYWDTFGSDHNTFCNLYATYDVLKLYLKQSSETVVQAMFCNGCGSDHYVPNQSLPDANIRFVCI